MNPPTLGRYDLVNLIRLKTLRKFINRALEGIRFLQQRRDILENDARLREVGNVPNLFG
jgi:hypothetical protein